MEKQDFYKQTRHFNAQASEMLVAYGLGEELTAHEATTLWMEYRALADKMHQIKLAAQARDWGE
jgi:hypothetical protein